MSQRCEADISTDATGENGYRCGNEAVNCPCPACETPELHANSCLECMDTRTINGKEHKMCDECCWKFDHPEDQTMEFARWLNEQNGVPTIRLGPGRVGGYKPARDVA